MADKPKQIVRVEPAELENAEQMLRQAAPDVLRAIPHNKRDQLRLIKFTTTLSAKTFSGPIPPPDEMERFNEIIPNGADRIMTMAEAQSAHRISIEDHVVRSQQWQSASGQIFGFVIGLTGLWLSYQLISQGHDVAGGALGGGTLLGMVTVFVKGKAAQRKDLQQKRPDA
jgi:uncharacterized membrane protein